MFKLRNRRKGNSSAPARMKKVITKPGSKRQVRRFLKEPLANTSAVIYFTEKDHRPFLLSPDGGGVSAGAEFKLSGKWKLTKDKLKRIFIIAAEEDLAEAEPDEGKPSGDKQ